MNPELPPTNANAEAREQGSIATSNDKLLSSGRRAMVSLQQPKEAAEAQRQQQQHCGLKKCDKVLNLKLLDSSSSGSSPQNDVSADRQKIARLESHLLETQRRSCETESILEAKLERALETNRVLRIENSIKLDEMRDRIKFLEDEIETEEWCTEVVGLMCDDMERTRRHDRLSMMSSKYDRMLRERDQHIRELEEACERKDQAVEMLTSELRGAQEEMKRLKLAEAAMLAAASSAPVVKGAKQFEAFNGKTSHPLYQSGSANAASIRQGALRRPNCAHATCA